MQEQLAQPLISTRVSLAPALHPQPAKDHTGGYLITLGRGGQSIHCIYRPVGLICKLKFKVNSRCVTRSGLGKQGQEKVLSTGRTLGSAHGHLLCMKGKVV